MASPPPITVTQTQRPDQLSGVGPPPILQVTDLTGGERSVCSSKEMSSKSKVSICDVEELPGAVPQRNTADAPKLWLQASGLQVSCQNSRDGSKFSLASETSGDRSTSASRLNIPDNIPSKPGRLTGSKIAENGGVTPMSWISHEAYQEEIHAPSVTKYEAVIETISHTIIVVMLYVCLVMVMKCTFFVPWDGGFALVMLWTGAMVFGVLFKFLGLPQLLGMLCAGVLLKNAIRDGDKSIVDLPMDWSSTIRSFGLVNILMRGGLELDVGAIQRLGMAVVRLTVLPGVSEALTVSGLGALLFGMPYMLALAFGFVLAAVSPAIVVGGMFDLQAKGYGVNQGIPTFVVAAASFDDVVAIAGFSMFIGLAITKDGGRRLGGGGGDADPVLTSLSGPINILLGVACGCLGGLILSQTKLWNADWKRSTGLLVFAVAMKFGFKNIHIGIEFDGAGALGALVMACVAAQMWARGLGGPLATGVPDTHAAHSAEQYLCKVWKLVSEPLLFSVIGSALDFSKLDVATIPLAVLLILGCVSVRTVVALLSTYGCDLNWKERIFISLAWMPKATVQAALGAVPLATIQEVKKDDPDFEEWEKYGLAILTTAVLSIVITAPAGLIVIQNLGPRWLQKAETEVLDGPVQAA